MYEGHLPASGIQRHSAGELFPCFIVVYGNGEARWVNPEKRIASGRLPTHRAAQSSARGAQWLGYTFGAGRVQFCQEQYRLYCQGE